MQQLGREGRPLRAAADRQPTWPEDLVGSITHTHGFCAAVVAKTGDLRAVGIDTEVAGRVKDELWPSICTARERSWLLELPLSQRARAATLIFSTKEAFYKCQYPLLGVRASFHDVEVHASHAQGEQDEIQVVAASGPKSAHLASVLPMTGRFLFHEEFVTVGMSLPAQ